MSLKKQASSSVFVDLQEPLSSSGSNSFYLYKNADQI